MQCKTLDTIDYKNENIYTGVTSKELESKEKIDNGRTFEVFFSIETEEKCLKFILSSSIIDTIFKKQRFIGIFYIVEKAVDISQFKASQSKQFIFSEVGKNFDYNWNTKDEITICTSMNDPIQKLDKSIYRIRFTVFQKEDYNFRIKILSENKIFFLNNFSIVE
ncbi:MAG: hypothetical protein SVZ03_07700 [Spirochaetota bacterium]|nr:hypothetical protein [Spirochaetota bacterium]